MNLIEQVKEAVRKNSLVPEGAHVFAGLSGGADSAALFHLLHRLGYPLTVLHLNHCIRGPAADADAAFVQDLCKKTGVPCVIGQTDVPALAAEKRISIEMAARDARLAFFKSQIGPAGAGDPVALAHHADDQIETFFLRAARGTGPGGLGGMRPFQRLGALTLIRPLLGIRKDELVRWLKEEHLAWREDVTNTDETILRNVVRHRVFPAFAKLNARAAENLLRTMEILRDEDEFLSKTAGPDPENLHTQPRAVQRRMIQRWLIEHGVTPDFDSIENVIAFAGRNKGSRALDLEGLRIVNEYGALKAGQTGAAPGKIRMEEGAGILRGAWRASVSLARIAGRKVVIRRPRPGDRMKPYGMEGTKKLQDIFTDLKIPKAQRAGWPVVECGGEIIWLPGFRIARGWELPDESAPALHLSAENPD